MTEKIKLKGNLTTKIILQVAFVIFIMLNLIDFLNILNGDLDFFKKILSWSIIAYVFYKASFTKIVIGKRQKIYDFLFIIAFSFMSIVKSLILYAHSQNLNEFVIFGGLLGSIKALSPQIFLYVTFLLGFTLTIILSISLLLNHSVKEKSFIGSLRIKEGYFKYIIEQSTLIVMAIFFGLILFNLFMEWFALAVDSIILVIGLGYYLFITIKNHTKTQIGGYIQNVANTGNEFYQNLITLFSDKKTIFIGISFLLTLHLLVDAGVYLVPYTIGTENTLYFDSLGYESHLPLFNFFNPAESRIYEDLTKVSGDLIISIVIFLSYLMPLFFFFCFMVLPFYFFYNNVRKVKIKINKIFGIFFLTSMFFYLMLISLPGTHTPILFETPDINSNIKGVDIKTAPIVNDTLNPHELITTVFLSAILLMFLFFRYSKYELFFNKIIFFVVLIFFLLYVLMFFTNFIQVEYDKVKTDFLEFETQKETNEQNYVNAFSIFNDENKFKEIRLRPTIKNKNTQTSIEITPFSDLNIKSDQIIDEVDEHKDYLMIVYKAQKENEYIKVKDVNKIYFESNKNYEIKTNNYIQIKDKETRAIYYLGENVFELTQNKAGEIKMDTSLGEETIVSIISIRKPTEEEILQKIIEYIRFVFTSFFYIVASISFSMYYIRKNLQKN